MTREQAIAQLSGSERGQRALIHLVKWLDDSGIGLDAHNQAAVFTLLDIAWENPGSTRQMMRAAIIIGSD